MVETESYLGKIPRSGAGGRLEGFGVSEYRARISVAGAVILCECLCLILVPAVQHQVVRRAHDGVSKENEPMDARKQEEITADSPYSRTKGGFRLLAGRG